MGAGMSDSLDAWFAREILVHEAPLVQYLMRTWPTKEDEIHDLRQETYVRVYEAAANERPRCAKSFLFATARRLLADRMARGQVVSFEVGRDLDDRNVLIDGISSEQPAGADEDLRTLAQVLCILPPQCRQVAWMRRVEQKSQKEIAACLGKNSDAIFSSGFDRTGVAGDLPVVPGLIAVRRDALADASSVILPEELQEDGTDARSTCARS
jgi:RNA polymerase sigma factor (sigma-70 family)